MLGAYVSLTIGRAAGKAEGMEGEGSSKPKTPPLRKLSSLKWPYIPDSATTEYPDPLSRDDPKPLTMPQYEAIGTYHYFLSHSTFPFSP